MKIVHTCLGCFFIDNYSYQENLLPKYHVKMGYDVTVIASLVSFDEKGNGCLLDSASEYEDPNGFHIVRLAYKWPVKLNKHLQHYVGLAEQLNKIEPDIIFMHGAGIGDSYIVASYLKKHPQVKLYSDSHADYFNSGRSWFSLKILNGTIRRYYGSRLSKYFIKRFGVTPWRCDFLINVYGADKDKVEYLPLGVDDEAIPTNRLEVRSAIRSELNIGDNDIVIFTGGKIDEKKNIHILLKTLQQLQMPNVHVIIAGVIMPKMEDVIRPLITSNVHYLGWCDAKRVMDCMVASDLACFPGTHSTLWEQSVGVGLPIIYKHWEKMDQVNVNGNAISIKGEDAEELQKALELMISNIDSYKDRAGVASKGFLYSEIAKRAIGL